MLFSWALVYKKFPLLKNPASAAGIAYVPTILWKPSPPPEPFPEIPSSPPQDVFDAALKPTSLVAVPIANTFEPLYPLYL